MPLASVQNWLISRMPEHAAPDVERDRDPVAASLEEHPEAEHDDRHARLRDRQRPAVRQDADETRVTEHQNADKKSGPEDDPGNVHRSEIRDQLGPGERLNDVVGRHGQEGVGEHQQCGDRFVLPHVDHGIQHPLEQGHGDLYD